MAMCLSVQWVKAVRSGPFCGDVPGVCKVRAVSPGSGSIEGLGWASACRGMTVHCWHGSGPNAGCRACVMSGRGMGRGVAGHVCASVSRCQACLLMPTQQSRGTCMPRLIGKLGHLHWTYCWPLGHRRGSLPHSLRWPAC